MSWKRYWSTLYFNLPCKVFCLRWTFRPLVISFHLKLVLFFIGLCVRLWVRVWKTLCDKLIRNCQAPCSKCNFYLIQSTFFVIFLRGGFLNSIFGFKHLYVFHESNFKWKCRSFFCPKPGFSWNKKNWTALKVFRREV